MSAKMIVSIVNHFQNNFIQFSTSKQFSTILKMSLKRQLTLLGWTRFTTVYFALSRASSPIKFFANMFQAIAMASGTVSR
jgi:hypothetical protein